MVKEPLYSTLSSHKQTRKHHNSPPSNLYIHLLTTFHIFTKKKMAKQVACLLFYISIFFCFYPIMTISTTVRSVSKEQIACTMCEACENPCSPPVITVPPPPPPAQLDCPPPPKPTSSVPYNYYRPPPPSDYQVPTFSYYSPPPPMGGGSGGGPVGGSGGVSYGAPAPPNPIVPYFPYYYNNPPPSKDHSSSTSLNIKHYFVPCLSILLSLFLS